MPNPALDFDSRPVRDSRMEPAREIPQSRRERCAQDILALVTNVGGTVEFRDVLAVYHVHYRCHHRHTKRPGGRHTHRVSEASEFLDRMQSAGLVVCTYDGSNGNVLTVRIP